MTRYKLSEELEPPHLQDVKAVLALDNDSVASCSRDGSIAVWERNTSTRMDAHRFHLQSLLNGHQAYVNSLALLPNTSTGCKSHQRRRTAHAKGSAPCVGWKFNCHTSTPTPCFHTRACTLSHRPFAQCLCFGLSTGLARAHQRKLGLYSKNMDRGQGGLVLFAHSGRP